MRGSIACAALWLGLVPAARPGLLFAQTDARLAQGVRLAQEGLGDSARTVVQRVVDATNPADTLYPQAIYARAVVGANPQDMRRDLQRVAVEYPNSSWADDALLRLAQLDYATREPENAARDLERLRLDYGSSPVYAQASVWAARAYFDLRKPSSACRWIAEGLPRAGNDLELRNQLSYYNQRCAGVALDTASADSTARLATASTSRADSSKLAPAQPGAGDTARTTSSDTSRTTPSDTSQTTRSDTSHTARRDSVPSKPVYRIQVAAVNTRAAADSIAKRTKAAGFESIVASEKGLFKIRVGRYATRAEAQAALPGVRAKVGGQPFIVAAS
jgi:cell division septation protein DedD